MKLKFFLKNKEKVYTIKDQKEIETKSAHYKFIKIRDAPKSDVKFFRKN